MQTFNLVDRTFAHDVGSVAGVRPKQVRWDRSFGDPSRPTFITDGCVGELDWREQASGPIYAWQIESSGVLPSTVRRLIRDSENFDLIFTHSSRILETNTNARWVPGGGVWIGGTHAGGTWDIFPKSRHCSMITTSKLRTPMHRFRLLAAHYLMRWHADKVDVQIDPPTVQSFPALRDYRFNICVENFIDDYYFTERLLNCFATGTVPIYRGARKLDKFFDVDGIIEFRDFSELRRIVKRLGVEDYDDRAQAMKTNFELVRQYSSIEDFIVSTHLAL